MLNGEARELHPHILFFAGIKDILNVCTKLEANTRRM